MEQQADQAIAFEAERRRLEAAIDRAWARVDAANRTDTDPGAQALIAAADTEVLRLTQARDRRLRSLDAAAQLALRADAPGAEHEQEPAADTAAFVAEDPAGHEPVRSSRFPLTTADLAR